MIKILSINVKSRKEGERGIPKTLVTEAMVNRMGLEGDYNIYRSESKGNSPDHAVLLMSEDILAQLRSEGWGVQNGDLGENITLSGIEYSSMKLGDKFSLGEIEIQITEACRPCINLSVLPYVENKVKEFMGTLKGRRGWYAKVLKEGRIEIDDHITRLDN